jgi:hypothetical protein
MKTSHLALAAALGTTATAASATPETWNLLRQIQIDEIITDTTYEVRKSWPAELEQDDQVMEITGYAAPLLPGEAVRELMLVSDMGACPFCGNLDHGASLVVTLAEPVAFTDENKRITIKGTFKRVTDPETWQAVVMEDARIVAD